VPYWNVLGFTAWDRSKARLQRADTSLTAASTADRRVRAAGEFDAATTAWLSGN